MTAISQSHGTLSSVTDESSTPSDNSQYFSVTSSLEVLDCNDEVYYSMEEDAEKVNSTSNMCPLKKYDCHRFVKENRVDIEDVEPMVEDFDETTPEIFINESQVDIGDWDQVCDNLNSVISQDSVSTEEEDTNNFSTLADSLTNNCSVEKPDTDNDENTSTSANYNTEITNSVLDGELSEINDIIYESSTSQDPGVNDDDSESLKADVVEDEEGPIFQHECSILEMVRKIEFSELDYKEPSLYSEVDKEDVQSVHSNEENKSMSSPVKEFIGFESEIFSENKIFDETISFKSLKDISHKEDDNPKCIEQMEESPKRFSALCCSLRRRKPNNLPKSKNKSSKSKSVFSFFKFYKKEQPKLKSPKSLPQLNVPKCSEEVYVSVLERDDYPGIPFIDADVGIYSDSYVPLAKYELYCD